MAKLIIPTPLRKFTNDSAHFESSKSTVKDVIGDLISQHDGLRHHLLDDKGDIRSFVRIYVGDEDIQQLEKENTPVESNTVISIIPAIAGGSN
jgi:sulfur-carrier protein